MEDLSRHITLVEQSAGVTQAARSQRSDFIRPKDRTEVDSHQLFVDGHLQREHARRMTQSINGLSTRIIFAKRSPQWDTDCVKFLLRLLGNSQRLLAYRSIHGQASRETLDYVQNYSEARLEVTQTSESRIQHQLNILYTSIAQDDGQTSARIVTSAGKNSTSMKIIALITASYLPVTFVATLSSMGMFEWQGSAAEGGENASKSSVSPDSWIYWAVAIHLTIITLAGWATWWKFEELRFVRNVQQAMQDKPS